MNQSVQPMNVNRISLALTVMMCCLPGCTTMTPWAKSTAPPKDERPVSPLTTPVFDNDTSSTQSKSMTVRGQSPETSNPYAAGGQDYTRNPMQPSGQYIAQQPAPYGQPYGAQPNPGQPYAQPQYNNQAQPYVQGQPNNQGQPYQGQPYVQPQPNPAPTIQFQQQPNQQFQPQPQPGRDFYQPGPAAGSYVPPSGQPPFDQVFTQPPLGDNGFDGQMIQEAAPLPLDVYLEEARTGRFMFGVGVNSDAGVTGQITLDERNFDITKVPTRLSDFGDGTAFRGAGQGFRIEAAPGSQVQRYLVSFTEPYLLSTPLSFNVSGYLFDRRYVDWDEQRIGGRVGLGYRLTPFLSATTSLRMENVDIHDPRVRGVNELDNAIGDQDLYVGTMALTHDTRDVPFFPTQGHFVELSYSQGFGEYNYPRGEIDLRRYFLIRERADGSGRHTFSTTMKLGFSGAQTPIFENYFAGGFSSLRGFDFRGAGPVKGGVAVGGEFRMLGSFEYIFPLTADDMMRGLFFVDYGTVEEKVRLDADTFRVAPGFGFRIAVPALGPAPLALDFAFPLAYADSDDRQIFSFFFGFNR